MEQTRLLMSLQLVSPIAWSLLIIVVAWSAILFCGFGVLSGTNPTTIFALALGAISVASAMYLILDLSRPLFRSIPCFARVARTSDRDIDDSPFAWLGGPSKPVVHSSDTRHGKSQDAHVASRSCSDFVVARERQLPPDCDVHRRDPQRPLYVCAVIRVRRERRALSSGCEPHLATAPAGSNRSSHGGDEMAEGALSGRRFEFNPSDATSCFGRSTITTPLANSAPRTPPTRPRQRESSPSCWPTSIDRGRGRPVGRPPTLTARRRSSRSHPKPESHGPDAGWVLQWNWSLARDEYSPAQNSARSRFLCLDRQRHTHLWHNLGRLDCNSLSP